MLIIMKYKVLLLLFLLILIFPKLSSALSVSGNLLSPIIYEPRKVITNHYTIGDTYRKVTATVGGDLVEYIKISEIINNEFDLSISFPDKYISPKSYYFSLVVSEELDSSKGGFSSTTGVNKIVLVEVYSLEKDILAHLSASNADRDKQVNLVVGVESRTYSDIDSVSAMIEILDAGGKSLGSVSAPSKPLKALDSLSLEVSFPTLGLEPGDYTAEATINFDGQERKVSQNFRIGKMDLLLKEYTPELELGFSEFKAVVTNDWSKPLEDVYAKLFIEGEELLQTPSLKSLAPWTEGELTGIAKINYSLGNHPGVLELYFADKVKFEPINIKIIERISPEIVPEKLSTPVIQLVIVALAAMIVTLIIGWSIVRKRYKKNETEI